MLWVVSALWLVGCGCPPLEEAEIQDPYDALTAEEEAAWREQLASFAAWIRPGDVCVTDIRVEEPKPLFDEGEWHTNPISIEEQSLKISPAYTSAQSLRFGLCFAWEAQAGHPAVEVEAARETIAAYQAVYPWLTEGEAAAWAFSEHCSGYLPDTEQDFIEEVCEDGDPFIHLLTEEVFPNAPRDPFPYTRASLEWEPVLESPLTLIGLRRRVDGNTDTLFAAPEGLGGYVLHTLETGEITQIPPLPFEAMDPRHSNQVHVLTTHYSEGVYLSRQQGLPGSERDVIWRWRDGVWRSMPVGKGTSIHSFIVHDTFYAVQPSQPAALHAYDIETGQGTAEALPFDGAIEWMTTRGEALFLLPIGARTGWYRTEQGWEEQSLPQDIQYPLLNRGGEVAGLVWMSQGGALYFGSDARGWFLEDACPAAWPYVYRPVEGAIYRISPMNAYTLIERAELPQAP